MKADIINKATRLFYKAGFALKKHSPTILVVGGCIGTVGAAVLAVKETPKALDILEDHKKKVEQINECHNDPEFVKEYNYTDKAYKNELIAERKAKFETEFNSSVFTVFATNNIF